MLVSGRLLLVSAFPLLQIPNFKTAASAHQRNLAFQTELFTEVLGQNQTTLPVGGTMFCARMELTRKDPAVTCRDCALRLGLCTHTGKLLLGHNEEILVVRFGENNEVFGIASTPARRNGDAIFFVDGMTKFAGEEFVRLKVGIHAPVVI